MHNPAIQRPVNHPGGCWACQHFHGRVTGGGAHAVCDREQGRPIVMGTPKDGCVYWVYDGRWKTRREMVFPRRRQRG
jgi:hypothetical protein